LQERLEENLGAAEVTLTSADLGEIESAFSKITVKVLAFPRST
jgi:hypothetical protein